MEFEASYSAVVRTIEEFAESYMNQYNDPSHDWSHVQRVRSTALAIAAEENSMGNPVDTRIVELASLLHDVGDKKFLSNGDSMQTVVGTLLSSANVPKVFQDAIIWIIGRVSFRAEVEAMQMGRPIMEKDGDSFVRELLCVQDADRLDAIGAIGIARCFSFNGARNLKIYEGEVAPIIVDNVYPKGSNARNHFYEKLLKIAGMLKTNAGRQIGEERQAMLKMFITALDRECSLDPIDLSQYA